MRNVCKDLYIQHTKPQLYSLLASGRDGVGRHYPLGTTEDFSLDSRARQPEPALSSQSESYEVVIEGLATIGSL